MILTPPLVNVSLRTVCVVLAVAVACPVDAAEPQRVLLWPDGAPLQRDVEGDETKPAFPTLDLYPARKWATGAAVVVCPGGGYGGLAMGHEGQQIAAWYNELGVAAFVLRYRHSPQYKHPVPMLDVQRAIRYVRANAKKLNVNPDMIGVMGFSAGGHLASTAATHFDMGDSKAKDPIDRVSCRPDFAVLCYPVISFTTDYTHKGSRRNLLGENPEPELVKKMSTELQVSPQTPPTFLFHTGDDTGVPPENSILFYMGLRKAGVPAELHIYKPGRHGGGLWTGEPLLSTWPDLLANWMRGMGYLDRLKASQPKKN
ncbi:MAG: alpha/beta hydrolase [Planctomycetota bacterium]|jgi:acetyl esterase/lipase